METLTHAIIIFVISALAVVAAGIGLARFGDELAEKTGWGALWVGTVLVSIVTSLPELTVSVAAVWFENSPGLALGNVFGANMINVFMLAVVAILFGANKLFMDQKRDTELLILIGLGLVLLAGGLGLTGDMKLGPTSLGGLLILGGYLAGMRLVYNVGQSVKAADAQTGGATAPTPAAESVFKVWLKFLACAVVVIVAGRYVSSSADRIAEATGIGSSFIGVLLVSLVTTLPETSVSVAAMFRKSYGIVVGNVYGSCAFNVSIIFFADLFAPRVPLLGRMERAHEAAAAGALALMAMGFAMLKGHTSPRWRWARVMTFAVPFVYVGVLYAVFALARK
jgi:cation:H+ antiporter